MMDVPPQIEVLWRLLFVRATNTKANNGVHHHHDQENGLGAYRDNADFVDVVAALIIEPPPLLIDQSSDSDNANNYPDPCDACGDHYARARTRWPSLRGILMPSCSSAAPLSPPHEQHQHSSPPHHGHYSGSTGGAAGVGFDSFAEPNSSSLPSVTQISLRELILKTIEEVCVFYHF